MATVFLQLEAAMTLPVVHPGAIRAMQRNRRRLRFLAESTRPSTMTVMDSSGCSETLAELFDCDDTDASIIQAHQSDVTASTTTAT